MDVSETTLFPESPRKRISCALPSWYKEYVFSTLLSSFMPLCHPLVQNPAAMAWTDGQAQRLDALLRRAKLSNVLIGKTLGVSNATVSRWRSGERVPNADTFGAMIEMAKGSADEVLGIEVGPDRRALEDASEQIQRLVARLRK